MVAPQGNKNAMKRFEIYQIGYEDECESSHHSINDAIKHIDTQLPSDDFWYVVWDNHTNEYRGVIHQGIQYAPVNGNTG